MVFNTASEVRTAWGFDNNTDITDIVIDGHIADANSVLLGYMASMYVLTEFAWSNFTDSHGERMLKKIELLLATWYLLLDEYGPNQFGKNPESEGLIKKAMDMIDAIIGAKGKDRVRLIWVDGTEFALAWFTSTRWTMRSTWFVGNESKFSVDDEF